MTIEQRIGCALGFLTLWVVVLHLVRRQKLGVGLGLL